MRKLLRIILYIAIGIGVLYAGVTCYGNITTKKDAQGLPELPGKAQAAYFVRVTSTGGMLVTNDYDQHGDVVGQRVFVLHGYYEYTKKGYEYRDMDITLKEKIFGQIDIKRR